LFSLRPSTLVRITRVRFWFQHIIKTMSPWVPTRHLRPHTWMWPANSYHAVTITHAESHNFHMAMCMCVCVVCTMSVVVHMRIQSMTRNNWYPSNFINHIILTYNASATTLFQSTFTFFNFSIKWIVNDHNE